MHDSELQAIVEKTVNPLIDKKQLVYNEWPMLKGMLNGSYENCKTKELCRRIIVMHTEKMPNMCRLCEIALCSCLTSIECEPSFSTQNRMMSRCGVL